MIDRTDTETTLYRVAISAFTYYPDKPDAEPGYTVDEDVAWCIEPLASLPDAVLTEMRSAVRAMITNPTANRRDFIARLASLAEG
ncbi:hypothetical protein GCM10022240_06110 [Microbacterium kribbense]|uniref:Uncharacterized protein n=1 Tax=Microbacterium kribbense TaxID=433645 RepID=A0ABP7G4D6_9MICO